jgi:hypothetical protein
VPAVRGWWVPGCGGWCLGPVWPCHGDYRASADPAGAARDRETGSYPDPAMGTGAVGRRRPAWPGGALGPEAEVRRERRPLVCGAGDRASPAGRRLERRVGQCLPQRAAHAVVPGTGCPAARRGRRARLGCGDLRPPAGRERRDAERLLRRVRLARARPGPLCRGQGRAGPDQGDSAQVHGDRPAFPPAGRLHDRRDPRALPAPDAGPPDRDYRGAPRSPGR